MKWHVLFSIVLVLFLGACSRRVAGTLVSNTNTKMVSNSQAFSGSDYYEEETWYALEDDSAFAPAIIKENLGAHRDSFSRRSTAKNAKSRSKTSTHRDSFSRRSTAKNAKSRSKLVPIAKRTITRNSRDSIMNESRNDIVSHQDMTYKEKYTPDNRVLYFSMMLLFVVIICLFVYFVCNNKK